MKKKRFKLIIKNGNYVLIHIDSGFEKVLKKGYGDELKQAKQELLTKHYSCLLTATL